MEMNPLLNLSVTQLKRAAQLKEQIDALNVELAQVLGGEIPIPFRKDPGTRGGKRQMSEEGRRRIAEAARRRWAAVRAAKGGASNGSTTTIGAPARKRTMSAAARKKIAAAQRARWAKVKAAKAGK